MSVHTSESESASSACSSLGPRRSSSPSSTLSSAVFASRRSVLLLKIASLAYGNNNVLERLESLVRLLETDDARGEGRLIRMDLRPAVDDPVCALFHVHHLLRHASSSPLGDSPARDLVLSRVMPLMPSLLRSFDPLTVDARTGNGALHDLTRSCGPPRSELGWSYAQMELLLQRGVSPHMRNAAGRTPLLELCFDAGRGPKSACAIRLLVRHGADLSAQDGDGNTCMHLLLASHSLGMLEDMFDHDDAAMMLSRVDRFIPNAAGQTAADAAAVQRAERPNDSEAAQLISEQVALWRSIIRPAIAGAVSECTCDDVASVVMTFIDGAGSAASERQKAEEHVAAH